MLPRQAGIPKAWRWAAPDMWDAVHPLSCVPRSAHPPLCDHPEVSPCRWAFRLFWSVRFNRVRLDGLLRAVGVCTLAGVTLLRRQRGDIHISLAIVDVHIGIVAVRLTAGYRSGGRHRISTEASGDPDDGHTAEQAAGGDEDDRFVLSFIDFPPFSDLSLDWTIPHLSA